MNVVEFRRRWRDNDWSGLDAGDYSATRIEFVVPGKPQPKQRARRGRGGVWYTPKRTKDFERLVAEMFVLRCHRHPPWTGDVGLGVTAYGAHHAADASNILKAVEDALNGIAYKDDVQVQRTHAEKHPVDARGPRTVVVLWRLDGAALAAAEGKGEPGE